MLVRNMRVRKPLWELFREGLPKKESTNKTNTPDPLYKKENRYHTEQRLRKMITNIIRYSQVH